MTSTLVNVEIDEAALAAFAAQASDAVMRAAGALTLAEAKRRAPVGDQDSKFGHPAGYLRDQINVEYLTDGNGRTYCVISSPALTSDASPFPGEPYGLYNEVPGLRPRGAPDWVISKEGPYLRPALEALRGKKFRSSGLGFVIS